MELHELQQLSNVCKLSGDAPVGSEGRSVSCVNRAGLRELQKCSKLGQLLNGTNCNSCGAW